MFAVGSQTLLRCAFCSGPVGLLEVLSKPALNASAPLGAHAFWHLASTKKAKGLRAFGAKPDLTASLSTVQVFLDLGLRGTLVLQRRRVFGSESRHTTIARANTKLEAETRALDLGPWTTMAGRNQ